MMAMSAEYKSKYLALTGNGDVSNWVNPPPPPLPPPPQPPNKQTTTPNKNTKKKQTKHKSI